MGVTEELPFRIDSLGRYYLDYNIKNICDTDGL